jgi:hypothetical protein
MTEQQQPGSKKWFDDAEDALRRVGDALRAAWDGTRDSRVSTLEAAKEAATRLSTAIDEGVQAARASWEDRDEEPAADGDQRTENREPEPPTDEVREDEN